MEKIFFPAVGFHVNGGHIFDFRALTKVHRIQNRFFKCSEKLHTHRRHINKETYRSVFSFVEYYIFNHFLFEKEKKCDISDFLG